MSAVKPILQAKGLLKRYGTVVAMSGADFELYPGEILGVIGDNGAGKSTLI
jgi:fructose transport system ATP-binding protein